MELAPTQRQIPPLAGTQSQAQRSGTSMHVHTGTMNKDVLRGTDARGHADSYRGADRQYKTRSMQQHIYTQRSIYRHIYPEIGACAHPTYKTKCM